MEGLLDPQKYIGRCAAQVEAFLAEVRPLLKDIRAGGAEIGL